jgi:hypothetical protein
MPPVNIQWTKFGTSSPLDITNIVDFNSIDAISIITKERGTFRFAIILTADRASLIPAFSDDIKLYDPSGIIFGGTVTQVEKTIRKQQGGILINALITVTDYGFQLDSQLVKNSYVNTDAADILAHLVNNYGPVGITFDVTSFVQRGVIVSTISFNYQQVTQCIQQLAQQIGWDWYVDPDKAVHFFFATTETGSSEYNPAPIVIDDTSGGLEWSSLDIDVQITNMKNDIFVIGGTFAKQFVDSPVAGANPPEYTPKDVYTTDGVRYVFPLAYRYNYDTLGVFLDGVGNAVGIDQQQNPADYQVMYNSSGPFLVFPSPPPSGKTLKVTGIAQVPIIVRKKNDASITAYGDYQASVINSQVTSTAQALALAEAQITLYGHPIYDVKFSTTTTGLRVGQIIMLNSAAYGVANYPLVIKRIEATPQTPLALRYQVEAIGSDVVTMNDVLSNLIQQANQNTTVNDSTVIQVFQDGGSETIHMNDSVSASSTPHLTFKWGPSANNSKWGFATWN